MRGLRLLGSSDSVKEEIHAIRSRRGQHHPLVMQVVAAARPLTRLIGPGQAA
jgi:LysR family transcriptional activator of nhaA